jgi:hypothetical protein
MIERVIRTDSALRVAWWGKSKRGLIDDPLLLHPKHSPMAIHNHHAIICSPHPACSELAHSNFSLFDQTPTSGSRMKNSPNSLRPNILQDIRMAGMFQGEVSGLTITLGSNLD